MRLCRRPGAPNLLVIVADDLGWHGSSIKTPNLDRLARAEVELDQHYVSPMRSPTRAALLCGLYARRFGVTAAQNGMAYFPDTLPLPRALHAAGYVTAITGKWHLGSKADWGPNRFGFDYSYGAFAGGTGPYNHMYKKFEYSANWHRNDKFITEEGHVTDLIAREASQWLEARDAQPFFLYLPFTAPHIPSVEPARWLDLYPTVEPRSKRHHAASVTHLDDAISNPLPDPISLKIQFPIGLWQHRALARNSRHPDPGLGGDYHARKATRRRQDKEALLQRICEQWHRLYHDPIRKYDSNHLILGDRNPLHLQPAPAPWAFHIMRRYLDVLSVNVMGPPHLSYGVMEAATRHWGGPILLADTGAGIYAGGRVKAGFQARDLAEFEEVYAGMMNMSAQHPQIIGFGWCGWYETPQGRSGIVDVSKEEPIAERLAIVRKVNVWMDQQLKPASTSER